MAIEGVTGGIKPYARPFDLVPPPRDRQFRTPRSKKNDESARLTAAWRLRRRGQAEAVHASVGRTARLWGSAAYRGLRAGLPPQEEEKLTVSWSASCPAKRGLGSGMRPSSPARGSPRSRSCYEVRPRKWRQSYPDLDGW